MEIERKFLVNTLPPLDNVPHRPIEQAYLCTAPVIRVRRSGEKYTLTVKGEGLVAREELNLPLTAETYAHLLTKAEGRVIRKTRYLLPDGAYTIELDLFADGLQLAEVEFPTLEAARAYTPPPWLGEDVSQNPAYTNAAMSKRG